MTTPDLLPLPPEDLRVRVTGVPSEVLFRSLGRRISADISAVLRAVDRPVDRAGLHILDFGCGCARVLRYLTVPGGAHLHGVDVDAEAIAWCTANLPGTARFSTVGRRPPLPYPDVSLDVIFAVSVFTHLTEQDQKRWLPELRRVLKPDGVLLLTVLGRTALQLAGPQLTKRVVEAGVLYLDDGGTSGLPDWYQSCFHTEEYVRREWSDGFRVQAYLDAAVGQSQDAVVLRPVSLSR
jgi:SAM-dependent methyltransferase